ncbi:hypothetical protein SB87_gp011 [Parapoxvirus red deer/HL953]|uniref:Uncharacterized protein n=1 Tax=Parapoxvirus red deer/HL953 TaxID=1579460 RepID=A0A0A7M9V4_9POXV|nr:hypothetical protein SB87_gp011 [Parapoxvirus red deer/HL953]AIZ77264.1 hypothetical protein [Parapoxvirus red deer/HL953]
MCCGGCCLLAWAEWLVWKIDRLLARVRRRIGGDPAYLAVVQSCDDYFTEEEFGPADGKQALLLVRTCAEKATPVARSG